METPTCANCKYFHQHYIHFYKKRYDPVPCGHCSYPRLKHRTPQTNACVHYLPKPEKASGN